MSLQTITDHFSAEHQTQRRHLSTRFICHFCGMPGVGKRTVCSICVDITLHRYCQNCPVNPTCCLHPTNDRNQAGHDASLCVLGPMSACQPILSLFCITADDRICIFCRDDISTGARYYACGTNPRARAHPTCFLVLRNTAVYDRRNAVDSNGHALQIYNGGGHYTCATCGDRGFGLCLRSDRLRDHHHPFCIESNRRRDPNRTCFKHDNCQMAWTPPPSLMNRPKCGVCRQKIVGNHYLCRDVTEEGGRAVHPMCAERLRQDRMYDTMRQMRQAFCYTVEALTLGLLPLVSGGRGRFHDGLSAIRNFLFEFFQQTPSTEWSYAGMSTA